MVPKGSWWWAAGGSCNIGERREVCSDKHLSGHRARAGQAGLGRPPVTMLVMGVGEGAGCRRSLGLYGCKLQTQMLCSCCLSHLLFCDFVTQLGGQQFVAFPPRDNYCWVKPATSRCHSLGAQAAEMGRLTVLEAGNLRSRYQQGYLPLRP